MTTKRGFTLIETMLALMLLSAIIAASASWTVLAGKLARSASESTQLVIAAQNVLGLIQDDLFTGDYAPRDKNNSPRIRISQDSLEIDARTGQCVIYRLDRNRGLLERIARAHDDSTSRPLIHNVEDFTAAIDQEHHALSVLIRLTGEPATALSRRYRLP